MTVEKMSSKQCAKDIEKVAGRLAEVKARIALVRPPKPAPPGPSGGTVQEWDPLTGCGTEYRTAFTKQDVEALRGLRDELDRLSVEEDMLLRRRETLQQRQRAAQAAEERAAAPGIARDASSAFRSAVPRVVAAVDELRAARNEAEELLRTIASARRLAGADSPGLAPEQLAAWWRLGLRDGETLQITVEDYPDTLRSAFVQDVTRYVPLPRRAVELVADFLGTSAGSSYVRSPPVQHRLTRPQWRRMSLRPCSRAARHPRRVRRPRTRGSSAGRGTRCSRHDYRACRVARSRKRRGGFLSPRCLGPAAPSLFEVTGEKDIRGQRAEC